MAIFDDMPCFNTLGVRLQSSRQECTVWFSFKYHPFQHHLFLYAKHRVCVAMLKAIPRFNSLF